MALGADPGAVIRLVLQEAIPLLGAGLGAGTGLSLGAGKAATTQLFGLQPHDGVSLGGASLLLAWIALLATYLPARRGRAQSHYDDAELVGGYLPMRASTWRTAVSIRGSGGGVKESLALGTTMRFGVRYGLSAGLPPRARIVTWLPKAMACTG